MDKSSGLKECPRCGLRNRRGAYQCDFCGWDFKAASDDWMGKVSDLERIGREVEVSEIDRSTRSKIELTMKRPADVPVKEKKPEKQLDVPVHLSLEDHGEVLAEPAAEAFPATAAEAVPYNEDEVAAQVFSPVKEASSEPDTPVRIEQTPVVNIGTSTNHTDRTLLTYTSMIILGLVLYASGVYLSTTHVLGRIGGWGMAIAASALIAFAVMRMLSWQKQRKEGEEELVLCPVCHEVVTEADSKCPSCGVKFKETSARE